jgi:hypothetical protein
MKPDAKVNKFSDDVAPLDFQINLLSEKIEKEFNLQEARHLNDTLKTKVNLLGRRDTQVSIHKLKRTTAMQYYYD